MMKSCNYICSITHTMCKPMTGIMVRSGLRKIVKKYSFAVPDFHRNIIGAASDTNDAKFFSGTP